MFSPDSDVKTLDLNIKLDNWKSQNEQSLSELFMGFMDYYSNFE